VCIHNTLAGAVWQAPAGETAGRTGETEAEGETDPNQPGGGKHGRWLMREAVCS
jgi:hypothetical protein